MPLVGGGRSRCPACPRYSNSHPLISLSRTKNSIPPTTTVDHLRQKMDAARDKSWIQVGFYGGVIPGNQVTGAKQGVQRDGVSC